LNVTDLLARIVRLLERQPLFRVGTEPRFLHIDADAIATQLAAAAARVTHPLGSAAHIAQAASVYWGEHHDRTVALLQQLAATVAEQLDAAMEQKGHGAPAAFAQSLLQPLAMLTGRADQPGFHYPFDAPATNQRLQRLTTRMDRPAQGVLDSHHVTVTLSQVDTFAQSLAAGVRRALATQFAAADDIDVDDLVQIVDEQLHSPHSDLHAVSRTAVTAGFAMLKREVQLRYLEYLRDTFDDGGAAPLLADLVRRLRLLEAYLYDANRPDGDFLVSYAGSRPLQYRDLFAQMNALDLLPIVPLIDGTLSSVMDQPRGECVWTFGVKLKLDGHVHRNGVSRRAFAYYVDQLDPDNPQHVARRAASMDEPRFAPRVLQLALLYAAVFADFGNLSANPLLIFDRDVLPALRGTDEGAKQAALRRIVRGITRPSVVAALQSLRGWLRQQLRRHATFPRRTFTAELGLTRAILERDLDRALAERTLFRPLDGAGWTVQRALRFTTMDETPQALAQLGVRLSVHVERYTPRDAAQMFALAHAPGDVGVLPVLIAPRDGTRAVYNAYFRRYALVTIPYTSAALDASIEDAADTQAFVARFTYALLSYVGLRAVVALFPTPPFVPIVRLHTTAEDTNTKETGETAIAAMSKVFAHLLSMDGTASTQGFNVSSLLASTNARGSRHAPQRDMWPYKLLNGLSSLYAPLPKRISFPIATTPGVERVAVLVVGSRVADRSRDGSAQLTTLYGEAIGMVHTAQNVTIHPLGTLAATDHTERLRREPSVLVDMVAQLRDAGYQHVLYIARAPAAATMFGSTFDGSDDLWWLSPSVVGALRRACSDVTVYPMFVDEYRALKRQGYRAGAEAYDMHDPKELQALLADPNQQTVVFYALFNGQQVGTDAEARLYNGVVTYATLLNRYGNVLDDSDLHLGLLTDGPLKTTMLRSLLAVHYARYEAAVRTGVSLKLNPYAAIIGDRALGGVGGFPHMRSAARFNLLAFLAEVRAILGAAPVPAIPPHEPPLQE